MEKSIIKFQLKSQISKREREYKIAEGIDLHVEIMPVPFVELQSMQPGESSAAIRARVARARTIADLDYAATTPSSASGHSSPSSADLALPILPRHMHEAVSYRNLDRSSWGLK